jgi:hypothetical protein
MQVPKIKIIDGELWICLGPEDLASGIGIVRPGELALRDEAVRKNEHKRIMWLLDNIDDFASYVQWKGNPPSAGLILDPENPWTYDPK